MTTEPGSRQTTRLDARIGALYSGTADEAVRGKLDRFFSGLRWTFESVIEARDQALLLQGLGQITNCAVL